MTREEVLDKNLKWLEDNFDMSEDETNSVLKAMKEYAEQEVKNALEKAYNIVDAYTDHDSIADDILNAYKVE